MDKKHLYTAATILAVIAAVAAFQKHVYKLPVVGEYLPGGAA